MVLSIVAQWINPLPMAMPVFRMSAFWSLAVPIPFLVMLLGKPQKMAQVQVFGLLPSMREIGLEFLAPSFALAQLQLLQ